MPHENELALALFRCARDSHVQRPHGREWNTFVDGFDEEAQLQALRDIGVRWLPASSGYFPQDLRDITDPPHGLFLRGDGDSFGLTAVFGKPMVAIVGARACSSYGASVARRLGAELARHGIVVVSGLSRGVEAEAHRGALDAGGISVAVLPCGIDRVYPSSHEHLASRICERGLIVSENAPGVEPAGSASAPAPWRFPVRSRIVAGLCAATVVVEARHQSGALITADLALEAGRHVFTVPGEVTSALSAGTNALLKVAGVTPLLGPADVLGVLGLTTPGSATDLQAAS